MHALYGNQVLILTLQKQAGEEKQGYERRFFKYFQVSLQRICTPRQLVVPVIEFFHLFLNLMLHTMFEDFESHGTKQFHS